MFRTKRNFIYSVDEHEALKLYLKEEIRYRPKEYQWANNYTVEFRVVIEKEPPYKIQQLSFITKCYTYYDYSEIILLNKSEEEFLEMINRKIRLKLMEKKLGR